MLAIMTPLVIASGGSTPCKPPCARDEKYTRVTLVEWYL